MLKLFLGQSHKNSVSLLSMSHAYSDGGQQRPEVRTNTCLWTSRYGLWISMKIPKHLDLFVEPKQ